MEITYNVSDLKKIIKESSNQFKPVIGDNVESDNKKNNGKAYNDSKKRIKDFDGGLKTELGKEKPKFEKNDANKTTLDYNMDNISDDYKKRVHAQVKGYNSVKEMENGMEKTGDFSNNENIYQGIKKSGKEMHDNEVDFKSSGLQASKMPKKTFVKGEMYESKEGVDMRNMIDSIKTKSYIPKCTLNENKKINTIFFKKTSFLTENHMISKIPDDFKKEGEQFKMKDKNGTEYIVEWNNGKANVISHLNKEKINEDFKKFHEISNYKSIINERQTNTLKSKENEKITQMLKIMRDLKTK